MSANSASGRSRVQTAGKDRRLEHDNKKKRSYKELANDFLQYRVETLFIEFNQRQLSDIVQAN